MITSADLRRMNPLRLAKPLRVDEPGEGRQPGRFEIAGEGLRLVGRLGLAEAGVSSDPGIDQGSPTAASDPARPALVPSLELVSRVTTFWLQPYPI